MTRFLTLAILAAAMVAHGDTTQKKSTATDTEAVKEGPSMEGPPVAAVSSIEESDIQGFEHYAPQIQELIRQSLALTKLNLTYTFGSADPKNGGMDCSGSIYYVLHEFGFKGVPRQSNEMAGWVKDKTLLHRVEKADSLTHGEFSSLQPGNLLFWSGTYDAGPRAIPVTHVMLYLGKLKKSGKHVVFGASDGRAYQGKRRTGVSVFDFSLPRSTSKATFYGYGMIPGVGKIEVKEKPVEPVVLAKTEPKLEAKPELVKTAEAPKQPEKSVKETAVTVPEVKAEPKPVVAADKPEEVRPAIVLETQPESAAPAAKPTAEKTESKPPAAKPAQVVKKSPVSKPKTSSSSASKPRMVTRKKPAPPPPTRLEKVKIATRSFLNDVRKSLPR